MRYYLVKAWHGWHALRNRAAKASEAPGKVTALYPVAPPPAAAIADAVIARAIAQARVVELIDHADEFWSIGDVVRRTIDGRAMTIMDFQQASSEVVIVCAWFEGTRLRVAGLSDAVLETMEGGVPLRRVPLEELVRFPENFLQPGDRVRLASGGPELVVRYVRGTPGSKRVLCAWLNGTKIECAEFDPQVFSEVDLAP